jgi:hypothetical protein
MNKELPSHLRHPDGILHVLNDYGERHRKTSLMYQLAKLELQLLLDEIHRKEDSE